MTRQLLLCLVILLLAVPHASAADCRALAETAAGLSVVDATGRSIHTVVANAKGPLVAAFAPGGRVIAYSPADAATKIVLVDLEGNVISETSIEQPSVTSVARLGWAGPRRLWYEGHTGPTLGAMELWDLPRNLDLGARRVSLSAYGNTCAVSPDAGAVACLGQISGSGKRFIVVQRGAGRENPEEVYPILPAETDAWDFDGALRWSDDNRSLTATVKTESDRWLLTLHRGSRGWQTEHRRIPHFETVKEQGARPERLLVGTSTVPVLDWICTN